LSNRKAHGRTHNVPKARSTRNSQRAATVSIAQPSSSFLELPRELRDEIYRFLLPSYTTLNFAAPTYYDNVARRIVDVRFDKSSCFLAILGVSRQVRAEASVVLYGTNRFEFAIGKRPRMGFTRRTGPSPYNTVRALPQSGISQIRACTVRVFMDTVRAELPEKQDMNLIREWLAELCRLLKQGKHLREIEVELDHFDYAQSESVQLKVEKFQTLLKPLEGLKGLKSAVVKGKVTEAYKMKLKMIMESNATNIHKKRKAETDREGPDESKK